MHIITRQRLNQFAKQHAVAGTPPGIWRRTVQAKRYANSHEVKEDFPTASFLGDYRTVFNIGGNKYRLVVDMRYDLGRACILHVLTHEEYDRPTKAGAL